MLVAGDEDARTASQIATRLVGVLKPIKWMVREYNVLDANFERERPLAITQD
jgi:hypothetical protein